MNKTEEVAIEIVVSGKVQGVSFRKYTQAQAIQLNLTGYVKNLPDGSVYIYAQGNQENVLDLYEWCKKGSPLSDVTDLDSHEAPLNNETDFQIRF